MIIIREIFWYDIYVILMHVWMYVCMYGWMDGRMFGRMFEDMHACIDGMQRQKRDSKMMIATLTIIILSYPSIFYGLLLMILYHRQNLQSYYYCYYYYYYYYYYCYWYFSISFPPTD